jgi:hypothetical protein
MCLYRATYGGQEGVAKDWKLKLDAIKAVFSDLPPSPQEAKRLGFREGK